MHTVDTKAEVAHKQIASRIAGGLKRRCHHQIWAPQEVFKALEHEGTTLGYKTESRCKSGFRHVNGDIVEAMVMEAKFSESIGMFRSRDILSLRLICAYNFRDSRNQFFLEIDGNSESRSEIKGGLWDVFDRIADIMATRLSKSS